MSVIIYFGVTALVILLGLIVVVRGWRHHYLESQKKKNV